MAGNLTIRNALLLSALFFLICFGLGYPILNRYDPGKVPGTYDASVYCAEVTGTLSIASYRPFVPALAKPFYWIAKGRIATWNPALFGMLMATSLLTAATATVIIAIGLRSQCPYSTSLVAALLFLVNFAVPNWNLAAYVDSGEALFLALITWSLLSARWYLLPLWAIPGTLSKETFAPFAVVFVFTWWIKERPLRARNLVWGLALTFLAGAAVLLSFSSGTNFLRGAPKYAAEMADYSKVGFIAALLGNFTAREFWYTFIWLLPVGLIRLRQMDRRWLWSTATTLLLAILFGAYDNALGNTSRALFNIAGPLLSISAAAYLTDSKSQMP